MLLSMIAAIDKNGAIGKDGKLPWSIPSDLKMFKEYTMGKTILMGYNTFLSLPGLLGGRNNIIFTGRANLSAIEDAANSYIKQHGHLNCPVISRIMHPLDLYTYFECLKGIDSIASQEVCIIGGEQTYRTFMPHADKLIISHVDTIVDDADRFFPNIDKSWNEVSSVDMDNEKDDHKYTVKTYERTSAEIYSFSKRKKLNKFGMMALQENLKLS